jgi:hypothetical protein
MIRRLSLLLLCVSLPSQAPGQTVSATTGAINGRVADPTGGILPGVSVTLASPSMMGTRSTVTTDEGLFRFPAVVPGDYTVTFELAGFSTIRREGIHVGVGFTATLNVEMSVASVQEALTVTGQTPVVDTASTKVTASFDAEQVNNLPGTREYWALLSATPAVQMSTIDVGGSKAMKVAAYTVYGTNGQHRPLVEGIVATYGTGSADMYYADLGSFAEVALSPVGNNSEAATPGMQSQFISKSGGNQYRGSVYAGYQRENFQAHNIDAAQIALGVTGGNGIDPTETNRVLQYRDLNVDVGGYLRKDKLWWYYSYRNLLTDVRVVNLLDIPQNTNVPGHSIKGTFNASKNIRLIGYYQIADKILDPGFNSLRLGEFTAFYPAESGWDWHYPAVVSKGEYNHTLSDVGFLELRVGNFYNLWDNKSLAPDKLRYEDVGNNTISGGNRFYYDVRNRPQLLGSFSYFNDSWKGTHSLKLGFEIMRELQDASDNGWPSNRVHILRNGAPLEIYLFESPSTSLNGLWTRAAYATDTWNVNPRLTLSLGVRFDHYGAYLPAQEHVARVFSSATIPFPARDLLTWNDWAPRIGGTFDLSGRGKTIVKFSAGSYFWNPATNLPASLNPNQVTWFNRYAWTDPNGNGVWDPGEEGRLLGTAGGVASETIDPNLKNTFTREAMTFFEHELAPRFAVRTGFVWRGDRNRRRQVNLNQPYEAFTVPVTVRDPGPDGVAGNGDDGASVAAFNLSEQYLGLPTRNLTVNFPDEDNFYTWELTGDKRMSAGWSLLASFAHTWHKRSVLPVSPNDLINRPDGLEEFTTWQAKVSSTLELPLDIRLTPLVRHQSGNAFGRTYVASLNYGNPTLRAEPIDANRTQNMTVLDVRAEKAFRVVGRRLAGFFDMYNVANANTATSLGTTSGTSYLRPLDIIAPRVVRLGLKFDW